MGCKSIHAIAAQLAGEHHCASHNDTGRLGAFSRALTTAQLAAAPSSSASATPTLSTPLLAWLEKPTSLSLHRVALVASLGLSIDAPSLSAPLPHNGDLHELVFDKIITFPIAHTPEEVFRSILCPLWTLKIFNITQLTLENLIIDTKDLAIRHPTADPQHFFALNCVTQIICSKVLPPHLSDLLRAAGTQPLPVNARAIPAQHATFLHLPAHAQASQNPLWNSVDSVMLLGPPLIGRECALSLGHVQFGGRMTKSSLQ